MRSSYKKKLMPSLIVVCVSMFVHGCASTRATNTVSNPSLFVQAQPQSQSWGVAVQPAVQPNDQWPVQSLIELSPYVPEYIAKQQAFDLNKQLPKTSRLLSCGLATDQSKKLANVSSDVLQLRRIDTEETRSEESVQVYSLDVLSTAKGCAQLATMNLKLVNAGGASAYDVVSDFVEPLSYRINYSYKRSLTNRKTGAVQPMAWQYKNEVYRYHDDSLAAKGLFPIVRLTRSVYVVGAAEGKPNFRVRFYDNARRNADTEGVYAVDFTRLTMKDKILNQLTLVETKQKARVVYLLTGDNMFSTYLNGKQHGLTNAVRSLPGQTLCYQHNKAVDIYKRQGFNGCIEVAADQLGAYGVEVSSAYRQRIEAAGKTVEQLVAFNELRKNQDCPLNNTDWVVVSGNCVNGKLEGRGEAQSMMGERFVGQFKAGLMVKGELYKNSQMVFDGSLLGGKPHGNGMCVYNAEFEECKYYRGQRVDSLYKMRKEVAKQNKAIAEQSATLAKQQQTLNNIQSQQRNNTGSSGSSGSSGNGLGKSVQDELVRQGTKKLLDQLF